MINKQFKISLDFDGTIAKNDVGDEIFRKFLDKETVNKIVADLLGDKISSRECWEKLCEKTGKIDKAELDSFILSQEIDPYLRRFVEYCSVHKHELFILSDGFDYYIDKILEREQIDHLKVYSNKFLLTDDAG